MNTVLVLSVVAWVCYWIMLVTVLCWEVFELVVLAVLYCY